MKGRQGRSGLSGGVMFFDPYPHVIGGAQIVTLSIARELRRRGVEVRIVTTEYGEFVRAARESNLSVSVVKMPPALAVYGHETVGSARLRAASALPLAWWQIGREMHPRPAVVHATDLRGLILAGVPARAMGVPVVWHLHLTEPEPALNRLAGTFANLALTPSTEALSVLPRAVQRKGRVLHNGIPPEALAGPYACFDEALVVTAGRISPQKGIDVLAEAASLLREQVPGVKVRVFGAQQLGWESYHSGLVERIDELGLAGSFELVGHVERPAAQWGAASVYVQPSRREGLPLAVVEAMAAGLPVVASDVGGLSEVVDHGTTGLLVPPDDPHALAEALSEILGNRERARAMGQAGRARVEQLYTMSSMVDRLIDLYRGLT